jgi:NTP pyrophosphatase (non-canonical NTP hydrolase)
MVTVSDQSPALPILNYSLGLAGESGETVDLIKKFVFHNHDVNHEKLIRELGDVLWYVSALSTSFGYKLEDVAKINVEKLIRRYPNGFKAEDSVSRGDETENDEKV